MTVCHMTWSKVKIEVTEVWNVWKWPISKALSSTNIHVIKRLMVMVNYDTPRQCLKFNQTCDTYPSNLGCSTFGRWILPLMRRWLAVQHGAYFLNSHIVYTVWVKKKSPLRGPDIFLFFHKRLRIFNRFFTHLLYVPIYGRLQIFIQLSPILTTLCHINPLKPTVAIWVQL